MRYVQIIFLVLTVSASTAQIVLERQVIASSAIAGEGSIQITSTIGQPEFESFINDTMLLTQGFEQPRFMQLPVQYELVLPPCSEGTAILGLQAQSCNDQPVIFLLNGIAGEGLFTDLIEGTYQLQASDGSCGYSTTINIDFSALPPCDLIVYTALTPNNDGMNDIWFLENITTSLYMENKVSIFNRWGNLVWEASDYNNEDVSWNGQSVNDGDLPGGTYFYTINTDAGDFHGFIELIR